MNLITVAIFDTQPTFQDSGADTAKFTNVRIEESKRLNVRNKGVNVNGPKATKRKKSGKNKSGQQKVY